MRLNNYLKICSPSLFKNDCRTLLELMRTVARTAGNQYDLLSPNVRV